MIVIRSRRTSTGGIHRQARFPVAETNVMIAQGEPYFRQGSLMSLQNTLDLLIFIGKSMVCNVPDMHNPAAALSMKSQILQCPYEIQIILMCGIGSDVGIRDNLKS
ncbi:hypothetical protein D3C75_1215280 [compost metagenome]